MMKDNIVNLDNMTPEEVREAYNDRRAAIMLLLLYDLYVNTNGNNPPVDCDLLCWFLDQHERKDGKWKYIFL